MSSTRPTVPPRHTLAHGGAGLLMAGMRDLDQPLISTCNAIMRVLEGCQLNPIDRPSSYLTLRQQLGGLLTQATGTPAVSDAGLRAKAEVVRESSVMPSLAWTLRGSPSR